MVQVLNCRYCGPEWADDTNEDGWWCAACDGFNYWEARHHANHKFTILLEDKCTAEGFQKLTTPFKKQLSPLRYPGGKSKMIDYIATYIRAEKCDTLISPFVGGGSLELALLEANVIKKLKLNDLDYGIYALWWSMLNMPDTLIYRIEQFQPTQKAFFEAQALIKTDYRHLDLLEAAWITLLVNRLAYSGIAKANPLGGKNGSLQDLTARWNPPALIRRIQTIHSMADRIELYCEDAITFIEDWYWDDRATVFVDPPYYVKGAQLYNHFFTEKAHINLSFVLQAIHKGFPNADVIVTYDFHEFIDNLYESVDERQVIGRRYSI